jgi:hypothetical protein
MSTDLLYVGHYAKVTNPKLATFGKVGLVVGFNIDENSKGITLLFSDNKKMVYQPSSIEQCNQRWGECIKVTHKGSEYLITPKNSIVSLTTNRIMAWSSNHPTRLAILAIIGE